MNILSKNNDILKLNELNSGIYLFLNELSDVR